jgi:succinoglycan biosynthesis protein ExoA
VKITAIVATFNEERHIGRCLYDLLSQKGVEDFEILVIDGKSRDRTIDVIRSFPEFGSRIKLIENPRRLQVYAWNLGWRAAQGEYIAFIGAHSSYGSDYMRRCLETMERTGADAVGPVQSPEGTSVLGAAIAWCMSSRFGIGNARFRFAQREEEVDSVYSMFVRRDTLERLGGYDERIAFDEDDEFNYRLRSSGGRIIVSPWLGAKYFVRSSLRALRRQMFCYGYWRRFTSVLHPRRVPLRVYAPPGLVAGLVVSGFLWATPLRPLGAVVPAAYAAFVAAAWISALRTLSLPSALCVPVTLPCMHLSYGLGFWRALFTPTAQVLPAPAARGAAR